MIPEALATEDFYTKMMNLWREGQELQMPEGSTTIDRPLSITEDILPEDIKTMRGDLLNRAKTEWHFVVLSSKLYATYSDEINEIKERIEQLSSFDNKIWEEMKSFWGKVSTQAREKNLFREHTQELRDTTNALFDKMKEMKKEMNAEFDKVSKEHLNEFFAKIDDIEDRISKGLGLQPIFNELKDIQKTFKDTKFNRKDGNTVWKRIDKAFKAVKEKKYGGKEGGGNSPLGRVTSRLEGLLSAIKNMEASINRDKRDEQFQSKRINTTDGQLELQLRQAKLVMIQERIASKERKLKDMLRTKADLEKKIEVEKKREEQKAEKAKVAEAKAAIKEEIANEIKQNAAAMESDKAKLESAAEAIKESKGAKKASVPPVAAAPSDSEDHIPKKAKVADAKEEE